MLARLPSAAGSLAVSRPPHTSARGRRRMRVAAALAAASIGSAGHAQNAGPNSSSVLVTPAIPQNFDRGRNLSVLERPRPDYDALGFERHGFFIYPQLQLGAGATSNVYQTEDNAKGAAFLSVAPLIRARSDWGRDEVSLYAAGSFNRYIGESRRNENSFDLRALGRKDIGREYAVTAEAQVAKLYESPETGAIDPSLSVLSSYLRSFFSARGQYQAGRGRVLLALDRTGFDFQTIHAGNGLRINQDTRDRVISRVTGEVQYALTPSVSLYGQASYGVIDYSRRLAGGVANRDSDGLRLIGGVNFDISGFVRGKAGVGFIARDFRSSGFRDVQGFSAEAQIEYFPTELLTLGLQVGRTLTDSDISASGVYFDNQVEASADYELLRNLIVSATGQYRRQDYVQSDSHNDYYRTTLGARYLSSPLISVTGQIAYMHRTTNGGIGGNLDDVRGQIGIVFHR